MHFTVLGQGVAVFSVLIETINRVTYYSVKKKIS
jgi:hypothetical protein